MKKFLSLVLSIALCLSCFVMPTSAVDARASAESLAAFAEQQVGKSQRDLKIYTGQWCAHFVDYCINRSSIVELAGGKIPLTYLYCWQPMLWAAEEKRIATTYIYSQKYYDEQMRNGHSSEFFVYDESYTPSRGDIFLMGSRKNGTMGHTGIVTGYDPTSKQVYFVDGNNRSNGGKHVNKGSIPNTWDDIVGYVHWNDSGDAVQPTMPTSKPIIEAKVVRPSEGLYTLTPACAPNSALDVANKRTDNEANLHIWQRYDPLTSPNQQWQLERVDGDYYTIKNENSGRVASIERNYTTKGSTVWQYGYGASNAQKWRFEDAGDGYYYIVPKQNTDLCLDVSGASDENGANVQVYTKNYTDAQKWKLVPVEKPVPTYTVHFDANGGKVSQTSKTVTEGDFIGTMPEPSRKGYEFQFWGSERDGTCMVVTSNNLYVFEDTTLYAHWKEVEPSPAPAQEPEWKEGWDKLKDALTGKNDKSEEEPPVTSSPEPEPPVTPSPEPEQKVESTLKIKGLTATITDKGIGVTCTVNSNYELTDFSDELRDANGIGRNFGMGFFGKGKTEDELEIEYRFGRLWKKGTYVVTVKVEDTSGREVNASVAIELPFDIDGEGRPVKK